MSSSLERMRGDSRVLAYAAAGMYAAAALDAALEAALPGDPPFSWLPVFAVIPVVLVLLLLGPRLPRRILVLFAPLGVGLIAYALATTPGAGDGAVLYALPVLWMSFFYGRAGAIAIVACVAGAHLIVLEELPAASSYPGRWIDVMIASSAIAVVVSELQRRNQTLVDELTSESRTDALTGLLNRRGFEDRVEIELAHSRRDGYPVSVASFDIDYFKRINDEWGHKIGDRVLAHVAHILERQARETDVIARLGGEEFVVLLPRVDSRGAEIFTERVRLALREERVGDELPQVRVSAGVACTVSPASLHDVLERADSALYAAKRTGRDRTVAIPVLECTSALAALSA